MFQAWALHQETKTYEAVKAACDRVPAGSYFIGLTRQGDPSLRVHEGVRDDICQFTSGPLPAFIREVAQFWDAAPRYKKLGVAHKRGFLLYGPPGCGKTSMLAALRDAVVQRDGLVLTPSTDISRLATVIQWVRQIEKTRPLAVILEDVENYVEEDGEADVTEFLDGSGVAGDNLVVVATTNDLARIPDRIKDRPSRIDRLIEVGIPSSSVLHEYLMFVLDKLSAGASSAHQNRQLAQAIVRAAEGRNMSLAAAKEVLIAHLVMETSIDSVVNRVCGGRLTAALSERAAR